MGNVFPLWSDYSQQEGFQFTVPGAERLHSYFIRAEIIDAV